MSEEEMQMCEGCAPDKPLADSVFCVYCPYLDQIEEKRR